MVFCTGDVLGADTAEFVRTCGRPVILEPFAAEDLERVVADALTLQWPRG